jgi:hypothetical protein
LTIAVDTGVRILLVDHREKVFTHSTRRSPLAEVGTDAKAGEGYYDVAAPLLTRMGRVFFVSI